jgi:serine/threonine protein kinase
MFRKALPEERVIPEHQKPEELGWSYTHDLGGGITGSAQGYWDEKNERSGIVKRANDGIDAKQQLTKEAEVLKNLQGIPGVPVLHGHGHPTGAGRIPWIATDHARNGGFMSLQQLLLSDEDQVSGKLLASIYAHGSTLLDSIHGKGHEHNDLGPGKLEHIYVHPKTGEVRLIDFGNASRNEDFNGGKKDHGGFAAALASLYRAKHVMDNDPSWTEARRKAYKDGVGDDESAFKEEYDRKHKANDPDGAAVLEELDKRATTNSRGEKTSTLGSPHADGTISRLSTRLGIGDGLPPASKVVQRPETVPAPITVGQPVSFPSKRDTTRAPITPEPSAYTYVPPNEKLSDLSGSTELTQDAPQVQQTPAPQVTPAPEPQVKPFNLDNLGVRYGAPKRR